MKSFAILKKSTNSLHTVDRSDSAASLAGVYPSETYDVVDMTGKDEIPWKNGTTKDDYTVVDGEWTCKLTDEEITTRLNGRRETAIRRELVQLNVEKDKATALGTGYEDTLADINARITALETELAGL